MKDLIQVLPLDCAEWHLNFSIVEPDPVRNKELCFQFLFSHGAVLAGRLVGQSLVPVRFSQDGLYFCRTVTGCVKPANNGAHAGAGNVVDRHLQLFQCLQNTNVGATAGTPAAERQTDFRPAVISGAQTRHGQAGA